MEKRVWPEELPALLPELVPTTPPPKEREYSGRGQKRDLEPQVPPHDPYQESSYREARKQGTSYKKHNDDHKKHNAEHFRLRRRKPGIMGTTYTRLSPLTDPKYLPGLGTGPGTSEAHSTQFLVSVEAIGGARTLQTSPMDRRRVGLGTTCHSKAVRVTMPISLPA